MSTVKTQLETSGLSYATCSGTIEDAVGSLDGVSAVDSNFATDEASVEYDPSTTSLIEVYAATEDAGYEPVRDEGSQEAARESAAEREREKQRRLVLFGGALTVPFLPAMAGSSVSVMANSLAFRNYDPPRGLSAPRPLSVAVPVHRSSPSTRLTPPGRCTGNAGRPQMRP